MFAVFENTNAEWSNLPLNYRESTLYTANRDVEGMHCSGDQPEDREVDDKKVDDNKSATELSTTPADSVPPESGSTEPTRVAQLPQTRKMPQNPVKHVANITRATLQQLKELKYLSQDTDTLNDVTTELKSHVAKLSATVPKRSEGIYFRASPKRNNRGKKKTTKPEIKQKFNNVGCIAKKKKKGKKQLDWWLRNHVGSKANMMKKFYKVNVPVSITI